MSDAPKQKIKEIWFVENSEGKFSPLTWNNKEIAETHAKSRDELYADTAPWKAVRFVRGRKK